MNQPPKSKLLRLVEFLFRLAGVMVAWIFFCYLQGIIFMKLGISIRAGQVLVIGLMVAGYAWAIHYDLPFFVTRSKRQRWAISILLALLPSALVVGCLWLAVTQFLQDFNLAKFPSPTVPQNEAWFMDGGFHERDLIFIARPAGQKPRQLVGLCWFPECKFSSARWSRDGQVIVCSVESQNAGDQPVLAIGFDFNQNQPIIPSWLGGNGFQNATEAEWKKQDAALQKIIAAHGGFGADKIDDTVLKSREIHPWFWQLPK